MTFKQEQLLYLMQEVNAFCSINGIKFSLAFGSLLGAVRDKGFIPWDDDMDIVIDRANYELLLNKFAQLRPSFQIKQRIWVPYFCLNDDKCQIDIFIIDKLPPEHKKQIRQIRRLRLLQLLIKKRPLETKNIFLKLLSFPFFLIGKIIPKHRLIIKYSMIEKRFANIKSEYSHISNGSYGGIKKVYQKLDLSKIRYVKFENALFPIIEQYDYFLKLRYGNYLIPNKTKTKE